MLPSNVSFGTVVGRFMRAVADGADSDRDPDGIPVEGLKIRFEPSAKVFKNPEAGPPVTIIHEVIEAVTNSDGFVVGPDNIPGVRLLATDDPDLLPTGWTWRVSISGTGVPAITFSFLLPSDGVVDLTTVLPVPSNPGAVLKDWEIAVNTTEAAAERAVDAAARAEAVPVTNDGIMAPILADPDSASGAQLRNTIAWETTAKPASHVALSTGGLDETAAGGAATVTRVTDPQYVESGARSWRVVATGSGAPQLRITPGVAPIRFPEASAVCARVFIPDLTKINVITIDVYGDPGPSHVFADRWSRNTGATNEIPLVQGWQTIRFNAVSGVRRAGKWGNAYRVDVTGFNAAGAAGAEFIVDRVWVETPRQASICIVEDGPYVDFMMNAYPDLRARGIPVTWAVSVLGLGTSKTTDGIVMTRMTEAQVASVAFENGNSVSAHSWGDLETAAMSADQIEIDVLRTTKWLQSRGYSGRVWRAAWWQNRAPEHAAARPFYVGEATYRGDSGVTPWPPLDMHNIPRMAIDTTVTNALMDQRFEELKSCRGAAFPFFHRVAPDPGMWDTSTAQWNYFLEHVDTGIAEGWLRADTFETLFARIGGTFREGIGGGTVAEYVNPSGVVVTKRLP